jgi:hypothetical protein
MERSKRALCIIYNKVLKKVDKKKTMDVVFERVHQM